MLKGLGGPAHDGDFHRPRPRPRTVRGYAVTPHPVTATCSTQQTPRAEFVRLARPPRRHPRHGRSGAPLSLEIGPNFPLGISSRRTRPSLIRRDTDFINSAWGMLSKYPDRSASTTSVCPDL